MKYRIEYTSVCAEGGGVGSHEFEAESDEKAASQVRGICQKIEADTNKKIESRYWHYRVRPVRLVRIIQPEISDDISTLLSHSLVLGDY